MTIKSMIRKWVRDNFGESEVNDPSWNIDLLAEYIETQLKKTREQVMMAQKHRIENFFVRARSIIDDTYGSDTDMPFEDSWDKLEKEFGGGDKQVVLLQYEYDDYEPYGIAGDCLDIGMRWNIIDHTEISLSDWNSIFVVIVVEKPKAKGL